MIEKRLGKIDFVEFGSMKDYPFQLGLQLGFSMSGSGVMDGGKYLSLIHIFMEEAKRRVHEELNAQFDHFCKLHEG